MLTFKNCYDQVMSLFDVVGDTGTDLDVTKAAINRANAQRVQEHGYEWNLSPKRTLSVVAGTQRYILPYTDVDRLYYAYNVTDKMWLEIVPFSSLPDEDYRQTTDDYRIVVVGVSPVKTQPTTADTITANSTVSEDGAQSVYIEGLDSNGDVISDTLLDGGTSVNTYASVTYMRVTGTWVGTLTVATTGGTTLVTFAPGVVAKQYPIVEFVNIPASAATIEYRYFKRARLMVEDNDIPDIPYPMSNILVYDALLELATYNELDSESVNIWRERQRQWLDNMVMAAMPGMAVHSRTARTYDGV